MVDGVKGGREVEEADVAHPIVKLCGPSSTSEHLSGYSI